VIAKSGLNKKALGGRLTVCTSGGAGMASELANDLRELLAGVSVISLYGTRETGGIARDGNVYRGVHVLVRKNVGEKSEEDFEFSETGSGEVLVSSSRLVGGYVSGGENSCFLQTIGGKSYYATGDYGVLEKKADGGQRLQIVDRCVDRVKLASGRWFSPQELEQKIELFCPNVSQAFAWPDETSGGIRVAIFPVSPEKKEEAIKVRAVDIF
jgi:long-subunit acyl-CoA synthetase (AMP-forming)